MRLRSNRTIVGLKVLILRSPSESVPWQQSHHCGIERSSGASLLMTGPVWQQSHHCGIESGGPKSQAGHKGLQQSHHCGIESVLNFGVWTMDINGQQSHHCGIERFYRRAEKHPCSLQQSHHCGIERRRVSLDCFAGWVPAAIAPLWD